MGLDNPLHIAFLVVILLLVFGAKRLPEIGRSIGSGMREFKHGITGDTPPQQPALTAAQPPPPAQTPPPAQAPAQTPVADPGPTEAPPAEPQHAAAEPPS